MYRLSAQAGNPLSERKLAQMFGRASRRWARARIADARRAPSSGLTKDPAITVGARSRCASRPDPQGSSASVGAPGAAGRVRSGGR
jgi:hypothetical protein